LSATATDVSPAVVSPAIVAPPCGTMSAELHVDPSPQQWGQLIEIRSGRCADNEFTGHRKQLTEWAVKKGPDGVEEYKAKKNATSIDGLPSLAGLD